jgi:hypothetical protein
MSVAETNLEPPPGSPPPPGPPARPSPSAAYRARRARRRAPWTATLAGILAVIVVALVVYLATSGILSPATPAPPAPGIFVAFGNPTLGSATCGGTTTYPTETLRIASLTRPFTTAQASVEVIELGDGDILPTVTARPETTLSTLCVGAPPPVNSISWYAVLVSPAGQNLATYTYTQSWAPVPGASFPAPLSNNTALTFVASENISGRGYGAVIGGTTQATPISGEGVL